MGRIKTKLVKRAAKEIIGKYKDLFKNNFNDNKKILEKVADVKSKKLRNVMVGYLTRLVKQGKKSSLGG